MALWDDLQAFYPLSANVNDAWNSDNGTNSGISFGVHGGVVSADFTGPDHFSVSNSTYNFSFGTGDFTFSMWVNPDVVSYGPTAAGTLLGTDFTNYEFSIYQGNLLLYLGGATNNQATTSGAAVATGSWQHIVVTRTGGAVTIYVDNAAPTQSSTGSPGTANMTSAGTPQFQVGQRVSSSANHYDGKLSDVVMWKRALTSSEITAIYTAGAGGFSSLFGLEAELRSYYEASNEYDSWNVIDLTKGSEISITSGGDHFTEYYDKWHFGFGTNNGNSYLRKVGGIPVAAANNMTFACWAKDIQSTGDKNLVTFANGEVLIYVDNSTNELGVYDGAFYTSGVTFPYGSGWRHIAATYDHASGVTTFFIDGLQVGTATRTLSFVGLEYIGGIQGTARQFAAGLDDIVVWERKLTAAEIKTVFDASSSGASPFYKLIPGRQINDNNEEIGWLDTPLTNTYNKLNYHLNTVISASASSSYFQDFESTATGSLPAGWTTFGDQNWQVTGSDAHAGSKSAGSNPALNDNQSTSIAYTASLGSAQTLKFWWKVSSENNFDKLKFYIGGVEKDNISGSPAWAEKSYSLPSGSSILKWTYVKDVSSTSGQDAAWIDDIFIGNPGGITTPDGSGNDYAGTLTDITAADTGSYITLYSGSSAGGAATKFTASLNFNGSTSKLDTGVTPNDVGVVSNNEKSIMFWASASAWANYRPFFSMGANSTRQDFTLVQTTGGGLKLNIWGDDLDVTPSSITGWHHYGCTYDNGSNVVSIYIDGQLVGSKILGGALNTSDANNILIGAGNHSFASYFFSGSIQEFSLFSSELSAQNILDVYNHQYPKIVSGGTASAQNLFGSVVHNAPPNYAVASNMWGSAVHNAPPNYAVASNMWGTLVHSGTVLPTPETASVTNMWGSAVHNAPPNYAVASNMWGSAVHNAPPNYVVASNMWGSAVHSGPPPETASAINMWGSIVHNAPPDYAVALNMWGSLVHSAEPTYAVVSNMWGSAVHSGPPPETASAINMWGSVVHNSPPDYAVALNMWGSLVHSAEPTYAVVSNMWGTLVHSGTLSPPAALPIISASNPGTNLVTSDGNIGYVMNTYAVNSLSVQRTRTVEQVPFKIGTKGKQSLRNSTNTEFTGSS